MASSNDGPNQIGLINGKSTEDDVLALLQEMFVPQLDPDVVQMILTDCSYNVNLALETLFALVGEDSQQHEIGIEQKASNVSAAKVTSADKQQGQFVSRSITDNTGQSKEAFIIDYQVEPQENDGLTSGKSFYGSRVSTIYKSNEGLYTEDLVGGENGDLTVSSYSDSPANKFKSSSEPISNEQHGRLEVESDSARIASVYQLPSEKELTCKIAGNVSPDSDKSLEADASDSISSDLHQVGIDKSPEANSKTVHHRPRTQFRKMASKQQQQQHPKQNSKKPWQPNGQQQKSNAHFRARNTSAQNATSDIYTIINGYEQHHQHRSYQNQGPSICYLPVQSRNRSKAVISVTPHKKRHQSHNQIPDPSPKQQILQRINSGNKVLVLLRGCPGSGKTTLAREIQNKGVVLSTDNFFMMNGKYNFNPLMLSEAHAWNRQCTTEAMMQNITPVIIDNTNLEEWEMAPYITMAQRHLYEVHFLEPETFWRYNPRLLAQRNTHHIGYEKILYMLERFDKSLTVGGMLQRDRTRSLIPDHNTSFNRLPQNELENTDGCRKPRSRSQNRRKASKNQRPDSQHSKDTVDSDSDDLDGLCIPFNGGRNSEIEDRHANELWKSKSTPSLLIPDSLLSRFNRENGSYDPISRTGAQNAEWGDIAWANDSLEEQVESGVSDADASNSVKKDSQLSENMRDLMSLDFSCMNPSISRESVMIKDDPLKASQQLGKRVRGRGLAAAIGMTTATQNWEMPAYPCNPTSDANTLILLQNENVPEEHNLLLNNSESIKNQAVEGEEVIKNFTDNPLSALKSYFSAVPDDHLKEIYDKCNGDLHWVVDLLLESGYELSPQTPSEELLLQSGSSIEGLAEVNLNTNGLEGDDIECAGVPPTMQTSCSANMQISSKILEETQCDDIQSSTVDADNLVLRIDPIFAMQLQEMFGPTGFHLSPVSYCGSDLNVLISPEVAHAIHSCWAKSLEDKFKAEEAELTKMLNDEKFAKSLQEEEDAKLAAELEPDPLGDHFPPLEDQKLSCLLPQEKVPPRTEDFAARIKRRQLYEMFPKIDKKALDEVFNANNGCFADTVQAVEVSFCPDQKPQMVIAVEQLEEYEKALIRFAEQESLLLGLERKKTALDVVENLQESTYEDLRAEASLHYHLRKECFSKAHSAYGKGLIAAASFYSQQGHVHTKKFHEANKRASEMIIEIRNAHHRPDTLDLHMLHVQEALHALSEFIETKQAEMQQSGCLQMRLRIITGRGSHSAMGMPKIMPAVLDFLVKQNYSHFDTGVGVIEVQLKNDSNRNR